MSIWGKILGGAAGFAVGGPLGALIGAAAGHAVDKLRTSGGGEAEDATKRIAFTIAVIALGAKMAKADGQVTRDEIQAFKRVFQIPPEEAKNVGRVFDQARRDARGFEPYARQVAGMFADNPVVLEELLNGLFHIARADGEVSPEELAYLQRLSEIFGLDSERWERLRAGNMGPDHSDPYEIIGVPGDAPDAAIKSAYRKLVRENHPDRLVAQGMPQEFIDLANEKLATINTAYDRIQQSRGKT
jgi:DnaJ like chaperone protein